MNSNNLTNLIFRLWNKFTPKRRKQYFFLMFLVVFTAFTEVVSIGTLVPFLTVLTSPELLFKMPIPQFVVKLIDIKNTEQFIFLLTVFFIVAVFISMLMRLLLLWVSTRLSYASGADLSIDIYKRTLYQPYRVHVARNSSEVISGITAKTNSLVGKIILPIVTLINSSIMSISILSTLVLFDPVISISAFAGFGFLYALISVVVKKRVEKNGKIVTLEYTQVYKSLQEGLGGIRDVLLDGSQDIYCNIYQISDHKLRKAYAESGFIAGSPRYIMESMGMVMMVGFAYFLSKSFGGITSALPILGSLALGAQRLLPILQQSYNAWVNIKGGQATLWDVLNLLDQPLPVYLNQSVTEPIVFSDKIEVKNLSFQYSSDGPWVLKDLNIEIPKGKRIGIVGNTGSGKSTFLDIVMALLEPTIGSLNVDGKNINAKTMRTWQMNIAHVPQSIFLSDATIAENIAFGTSLDNIDFDKIKLAAKQAQIDEHITSLKEGYYTFVGERGIRLSGGQRQRIGIARALYKNASVIVFDEATSALDSETENAVMEAIDNLGKDLTILLIAHRLTTVRNCDWIIELKSGKIARIGTYNELFEFDKI
ncbi:ABC transporter ATP-binding protein [Leptospira noguchii]|uniref:ABC transporter, ATP-binding protein n=1 Tax=Leptospira noguchii serovar Panama str. CZ214 TaxID=1001595 RepID=T0FHB8_9LEPT|nr:ABC transporter ATP-binding protein [Leptospira noguchii]EQA69449.1 ABC transporter, ATP-binding protein [Leptospira noguchii serovar Panama str. CZ214]